MQAAMPAGSSPSLRPRTMLEILDAAFRIYRENFLTLITLTAVVVIPITIITMILQPTTNSLALPTSGSSRQVSDLTNAAATATCLAALINAVLSLVQTTILNGVITVIASERQMGRKLSLGEAWSTASPNLGRMASSYIFYYIVMVAFILVIGLGSVLCAPLIILVALVVYLGITIGALLPPVVMLEGYRGNEALRRTMAVARPRFWQIIGLSILVGVLTVIFSIALGGLLGLFISSGPTARGGITTAQVISVAVTTLINIILLPITPIGMTLLYYDSRIRNEGLDLALQSMGPEARPGNVPAPVSPGLFVQQDFVNMLILGVVVVGASLLFAGAASTIINTIAPGLGNLIR